MVKLIASDVDGTLVKDGSGTIDPRYYDAIKRLRRCGVLFVAASGRQEISIRRLFAPVEKIIGSISESGAAVWKEGKVDVLGSIPFSYVQEAVQDIEGMDGVEYMLTTPEKAYMRDISTGLGRWIIDDYHMDITGCPDGNFPKDGKYTKIALYYPEKIDEATVSFRKKWQGKLHLCFAGNMWLDCVMPGVNKGNALKRIQEDLGITPEETVAFGDNGNDLEMMQMAGTSYAVATARNEVKAAADGIIPSYNENGVLGKLYEILGELEK